jgi:hypothetical protein
MQKCVGRVQGSVETTLPRFPACLHMLHPRSGGVHHGLTAGRYLPRIAIRMCLALQGYGYRVSEQHRLP